MMAPPLEWESRPEFITGKCGGKSPAAARALLRRAGGFGGHDADPTVAAAAVGGLAIAQQHRLLRRARELPASLEAAEAASLRIDIGLDDLAGVGKQPLVGDFGQRL